MNEVVLTQEEVKRMVASLELAHRCIKEQVEESNALKLQLSEAKDALAAEVLRIRMLNKVHEVALKQNTAMLELADHYTGSLWPEEVQRAAKEILKAAKEATSEKRNDEKECPGCHIKVPLGGGLWLTHMETCPKLEKTPQIALAIAAKRRPCWNCKPVHSDPPRECGCVCHT